MQKTALVLLLGLWVAVPAAAQGRKDSQGIPPGHLPPPGECRVWYDGRPPGQQPPPTDCREAERIASRDGNARVIYGEDRGAGRGKGKAKGKARERDRGPGDEASRRDDRAGARWRGDEILLRCEDRSRVAVPRREGTSGRAPGAYGVDRVEGPFEVGYCDGLDRGRADARARRDFDPRRHSGYRGADRGYERRDGPKAAYQEDYRRGFVEGYRSGYERQR